MLETHGDRHRLALLVVGQVNNDGIPVILCLGKGLPVNTQPDVVSCLGPHGQVVRIVGWWGKGQLDGRRFQSPCGGMLCP